MIRRWAVFLWTFAAFGQEEQLLYFAHVQDPQEMKDISAAVQVIADVDRPVVDSLHRTLTMRGNRPAEESR